MEKNNLRDALEFLGIRGIRVKTLLTPPKVHNYVLRRSPFQWKDSRSKTLVDLQDVGCLMSYGCSVSPWSRASALVGYRVV